MIRRPRRSTLFPYTTLCRSGRRVAAAGVGVVRFAGWNTGGYGNLVVIGHRLGFESWYAHLARMTVGVGQRVVGGSLIRSEEHTSELQSRQYLVCRLLLEKKQ